MPLISAPRILEIRNLSYAYPNGLQALRDVSLDVTKGELVALVGPSGCGKSTLLGLLAGLVKPSQGVIRWLDCEGSGTSEHSRPRLTLVFQKDTLLPWLTVEKNTDFGMRFQKLPAAERAARVTRLLGIAGLEEFRHSYPRQLSGGMRRRVAFLQGVASLPQVLLLDEPFSALDEPTRVSIHREVLSIVRELGMTVILVTHDLSEAISLCSRVQILTQRPASIAVDRQVPFGYPRDLIKLRETEEYQATYKGLWHDLSLQLPGQAAGRL